MKSKDEFLKFHDDNPGIYNRLVAYLRQAKGAGLKKSGIRLAWERTRWFYRVEVKQEDQTFKLCDHYHMHYARLIKSQEPDLRDFIETKTASDARSGWAAA